MFHEFLSSFAAVTLILLYLMTRRLFRRVAYRCSQSSRCPDCLTLMHQGGYSVCSANVRCLRLCSTTTDGCNKPTLICTFPHKPHCWSFVCIICLAVIECGSKKAVRKTRGCWMIAGWLRRELR